MIRRPSHLKSLLTPHAGWLALAAAVALAIIGILAIDTVSPGYANAQTRWLIISLLLMGGCALPHPKRVGMAAFPVMLAVICLLAITVAPGVPRWLVPVRNGARCWINLYFMMFQPSEVAKIAFVLSCAWQLRQGAEHRTIKGLIWLFLIMLVPLALILKQPDLGTALVFAPALFVMLVAAGARLKHIFALVGLGLALIAINIAIIYALPETMQVLQPHQRMRIKAMISQASGDTRYIQGIGYQQYKATTLIGAGGVSGYGKERSSAMIKLNRLPENHNDMIFVVIVNRWGLLGGLGTLALYLLLMYAFVLIALRSRDAFSRIVVIGFGGLIFAQMAINVGVAIGLLPVTGITLPFISYGGSSLLATFVMLGLAINIAARRPDILSRPSFEFAHSERPVPVER